jgi:MFS family permease
MVDQPQARIAAGGIYPDRSRSTLRELRSMPLWPLAATLAVQTVATMALYSLPTVAPEVARDLHVSGTLVGDFVAAVYGVGMVSALFAPGVVRRFGGVRATQMVLLGTAGMVFAAAFGSGIAGLALAALVLGLGYGGAAPASTHLLVPHTPKPVFNLVMSLRQIGVPLGGVLAALILPPLAVRIGWRGALLVELGPVLALLALMEIPRRRWDSDREPSRPVIGGILLQPFALLQDANLRRLSATSFVFAGLALCMVAFMTVQLTTVVRLDLVTAGQVLAVYQLAGSLSRPLWGWVADRLLTPSQTLAILGIGMAATAVATGLYGPRWSVLAVLANALLAGCSSGGYTGVVYAEYATLGGSRRTEATGLGTAVMFAGCMIVPPVFAVTISVLGSYALGYAILAVLSLFSGLWLLIPARGLIALAQQCRSGLAGRMLSRHHDSDDNS